MGVSVTETKSDTSTPKVTTTAKERKKRPMMPSMKITGAKMDTSVRLEASTANTTWRVPSRAALTGSGSVRSRCR